MKPRDLPLDLPERNPYETPATSEQKRRLWQLGMEDRELLDRLGNEQADYALRKLSVRAKRGGYVGLVGACAVLAGSCYYAFILPAPGPGASSGAAAAEPAAETPAPAPEPARPAPGAAANDPWHRPPPVAQPPTAWEQPRPHEEPAAPPAAAWNTDEPEDDPAPDAPASAAAERPQPEGADSGAPEAPANGTAAAHGAPDSTAGDPLQPPFEHVGTSRFGVKSDQARAQLMLGGGRSVMVRIGDVVEGWKVLRVSDTYVQVEKDGRIRVVHRAPDPNAPAPIEGDPLDDEPAP